MIEEYLPYFKDTPDGKAGIRLDMDLLRAERLMVGTPCFGGNSTDSFRGAYTQLALECQRAGIHMEAGTVYGESDISRARNRITAEFLASDCTRLLWWDNDERPQNVAETVFCMMAANLSIVGAPVPHKCEEERYAINYLPDGTRPILNGATQVQTIGTGFMMEQRRVFETMIEQKEVDQLGGLDNFVRKGADDCYYTFFHPSWDVPTDGGRAHYHTEDYTHCLKWAECDGRTWLWPYPKIGHWGGKMYEGKGVRAC